MKTKSTYRYTAIATDTEVDIRDTAGRGVGPAMAATEPDGQPPPPRALGAETADGI
jgi:hypothetical protein